MTLNCERCGKVLGEEGGGVVTIRHGGRVITFAYTMVEATCDRCGHVTRFSAPVGTAPRLAEMDKVLK